MPETIIESVLSGKVDAAELIKWLNGDPTEDTTEECDVLGCNRSEFVAHFLYYLRNQTDSILRTNSNAVQLFQNQSTPEKILSSRRKHHRSISDPTSDERTMDSLSVKVDRRQESPGKDKKRTGRRVKTKLFPDDKHNSISSDESRLSIGLDRVVISSTPLKNGTYPNLPLTSPVTPNRSFKEHERCDTPRLNHRPRSHEKTCLGDYLVTAQKSSKKKKGKNISNDDSEVKTDLDLSNSDMFPEIGVRKSSSLRSERKRIKPTNIDKAQKSFSLNSFTSECFQQPSSLALEDNIAFKQQNVQTKESNSFDAERNFLKQERHKLMEKFNILNTPSPKQVTTPQIKVVQNNSIEKTVYIKSDATKIVFKEKIDILVDIYDVLIKNNLILSIITEIYFLISIILSKQNEIDYESAESSLANNKLDCLLKSIHNSTYFAVKSLWNQRIVLEVILDKTSLKILGENKKIRSFYADLAKFLLNSYGLKCEAEAMQEKRGVSEARPSNGVICFNLETDNVDNFPSAVSFQSFKKQRDMFYEIYRWYIDTSAAGGSRATFRARIKPLLATSTCAANHRHLAALFTKHMLHKCDDTQESKLSKLQRRLTCPSAADSNRLPHFSSDEMFYKEFIMNTDNEPFRVHLRDTLASELVALDAAPIGDERSSNAADLPREYLQLIKKLTLLAKFLGFMTSQPYCMHVEAKVGRGVQRDPVYDTPKERVLENELALRNYSQPCIDLQGLLTNAQTTCRLTITLPWLAHYLSMLDYTTLRLDYYKKLLKNILSIYSRLNSQNYKKNTLIYLKVILGWLFDLPHFPIEIVHDVTKNEKRIETDANIDVCDVVDSAVSCCVWAWSRHVNALAACGREQKSRRHVTPVSLPHSRDNNVQLQARLEEEFLKSQPASTRRVLELVSERVTSVCVRELSSRQLAEARERAREQAAMLVRTHSGNKNLLQSLQALYSSQVQQLRAGTLQAAGDLVRVRTGAALAALLPAASPPIHALAVKGCLNRLNKWIGDNWNTTAILCKDIEAEMKTLAVLGEWTTTTPLQGPDLDALTAPKAQFEAQNISPASCIINLKEQICLLLEWEEPCPLPPLLCVSARCVSPHNVFGRPCTRRAVMRLSVELCVVLVSRKPQDITESFLNQLHNIWNTCCPDRKRNQPEELSLPERRPELSPDFRNFTDDDRAPTPISDDENTNEGNTGQIEGIIVNIEGNKGNLEGSNISVEGNIGSIEGNTGFSESKTGEGNNGDSKASADSVNNTKIDSVLEENNSEFLEFFDRILCPRNIVLLSASKCKASEVWEAMATVLVFLLKNDYLSEDSLTEQCLAVYRQDWPQNILESLSTCMKSVSARWARSSTGKFTLFLDFLAEYCGDMDYDSMEVSMI